jgi:hypothetical protein
LLQIVGRLLHVVDFERDHAVAEMLPLRRGIDGDAVIRDQLDDGAAELQINEIDRHASPERSIRSRAFTRNPSMSV